MKSVFLNALAGTLVLATPALAEESVDALKGEAAGIVQSFSSELKGELVAAMKAGGPVNAIGVCNEKAPAIAAAAMESSGWSVGRSSHKLRNPANAPDAYTSAVIADFVAREAAGEPVDTLVKAEIVDEGGQQVFHFVKAIPTGEPCLNCHGGDNVQPAVVEKLAELYPDDAARGFTLGQMRGVFTLSKVVSD